MVKVRIVSKGQYLQKIEISGHANSDIYGHDLVCAAVSSIAFGTLNALDIMTSKSVHLMVNQKITIEVTNLLDETCQIILNTMKIQLDTIKEQYSKYIEIKLEVSS
ncbi:MAG: ribosomal-processing cysteine protease Prp [Traorella sp.]